MYLSLSCTWPVSYAIRSLAICAQYRNTSCFEVERIRVHLQATIDDITTMSFSRVRSDINTMSFTTLLSA